MRYFTRGWVNGEYSDDDHDASAVAYASRLNDIAGQLPEAVARLAEQSLQDAEIDRVTWEPAAQRLILALVIERAAGYATLTLTYTGALLGARRVQVLRDVARDRNAQILCSEVDRDEEGLLTHRLLFWPRDELTIDFTSLTLELADREDHRVSLRPFFIEVDQHA
jgi:hypothetical protein